MPATSGGSHALAAFVTLIIGTILSKYLWEYAPPAAETGLVVLRMLRPVTGGSLPVENRLAGTLVVMVGLSFLWGVAYHVGRHS